MLCCCSKSHLSPEDNIRDLTVKDACHEIKTGKTHVWEATFSSQTSKDLAQTFKVTLYQQPDDISDLYLQIHQSQYTQNNQSSNLGLRVSKDTGCTRFVFGDIHLGPDIYFTGQHRITQIFHNTLTDVITFQLERDLNNRTYSNTFQSLELKPGSAAKKKHSYGTSINR